MISSPTTPVARKGSLTRLELFPHQELEFRALDLYDLIISFGGIGSGKTTSLVLWLLWLMQRKDTGQVHALFALTTTGLRAISRVIDKRLDQIPAVRNRERTISTRPPKEWVKDWERRGIATPPRQDRYENIRIWPCGLHLQMGTVHNKSYEQYRGAEWGTMAAEEVGLKGFTRDAFDFLDERVRCGDSADGLDCHEAYGHRHIKILHSNPPESPDHFTWEMLESLERQASGLPGAAPRQQDIEGYPNLIAGIGPAILIPSRTTDNTRLPKGYVENKLARLDAETAARRLGGALTRTRQGRAYSAFSRENEHSVGYHRDRTLYVTMDFNNRPVASGLWHPLNPGEYPSEHERLGIKHLGKFGEVFDARGGGLETLCAMLLGREVGDSGAAPSTPNCRHEDKACGCWLGLTEHAAPVIFFGDGTGLNQTASGHTLWSIVEDVIFKRLRATGIKCSKQVIPGNDNVPVRVRSFNGKLCSAPPLSIRSAWIDPRCEHTINDLMSVVWDKTKPDVQKYGERGGKNMHLLTHLSDADGYMFAVLFPMGMEKTSNLNDSVPKFPESQYKPPRMSAT